MTITFFVKFKNFPASNYLNMKTIFLIFLLLNLSGLGIVVGQSKDINGTVTNEKGENIMGATIKVKGTTTSAFSDDNGVFALKNVPDTAVIVVSATGYQEMELSIADKTTIAVVLVKNSLYDHAFVPFPDAQSWASFYKTTGWNPAVNN